MELIREKNDALSGGGFREMVETAEEPQVFATGEPRIEAEVAAGVIAELPANGARVENGIVSRDLRAPLSRKKQRGENPEERGFAGAVCSQQRQRFARTYFE